MPSRVTLGRFGFRALVLAFVAAIAAAAIAIAAEVVEAEVDGTANDVTVAQGDTADFTIKVKATGLIRCTATPTNPATVRVDTVYVVSSGGSVGSSDLSSPVEFWARPPSNGSCAVTWAGDPTWASVHATVSAAIDAPLGQRTMRLRPSMFTPPGTGQTLRDDTPTILTFTVVEGKDRTPPSVDCDGPHGSRGDDGWWTTPVRFTCTASDGGSGLADAGDASFTLSTDGEGSESIAAHTVADRAGNEATAGPFGPYDVDLVDPDVDLATPSDGQQFVLGSLGVASYACHDTSRGSGVRACDGTVADGGPLATDSVGWKTFHAEAHDRAGRTHDVDVSYQVVYAFDGVFYPARSGVNVVRAGSAIPLRWRLGGVTDHSSLVWIRSETAACDAAAGSDAGDPAYAAGASGLTVGGTTFQWVWKTADAWAGTCRQIQLHFADGTTHAANFSFR